MKISSGTIARTIVLALALVNQVLTTMGYSIIPIEDDTITTAVSMLFTVAAAVASWWKNNSFSQAAITADLTKEEEKAKNLLATVADARNTEEGE